MAATCVMAATASVGSLAPLCVRESGTRKAISAKAFFGVPSSITCSRTCKGPSRARPLTVRAADNIDYTTDDASERAQQFLKQAQDRWAKVENKGQVVLYGGAAVVLLWFSSAIINGINTVPLLPKLLELVGLGYTGWFVYRYLLLKERRAELVSEIEELKSKITGKSEEISKDITGDSKF